MNEQTLFFDEKQNMVDEYVNRVNIYEAHTPFIFDFRGYKKYLDDNKIQNESITEEMVLNFMK